MGYYTYSDKQAGQIFGSGGPIVGTYGDDIFNLTATNSKDQFHPYGEWGDDTYNLDFSDISGFAHGHHIISDHFSDVNYSDTFNFQNIEEVHSGGIVVGRLEDFDNTRDILKLEGQVLDLNNLEAYKNEHVADVRLVGFMGSHNDHGQEAQQWLLIETATGGKIFYAIGGARIDMDRNGMSNGHHHEAHFLLHHQLPDFATLPDIQFLDDNNVVPAGYSVNLGVIYNDHDKVASDVRNVIGDEAHEATSFGDLIAAGLNDDKVVAKGGDDVVWGGSGNDIIMGGAGNDTIYGGSGNDFLHGGQGSDKIIGGAGFDTMSYSGASKALQVDLVIGTGSGGASGDTFLSIENVHGGGYNDTLKGNHEGNTLLGGLGNDVLIGRAGSDVLNGGQGNDRIWGGDGEDKLFGGNGRDILRGHSGDDTLNGGGGNDWLFGGAGDDELLGGIGRDTLQAGSGDNTLDGGGGNDRLFGGNGQDKLIGGNGRDLLRGGNGDDTLNGGGGNDWLFGGAGDDTFVFENNSGVDRIYDFGAELDSDVIDLHLVSWIEDWTDLKANHMKEYQDDVIIEYGANQIIIADTTIDYFIASDFLF